MSKTLLLAGTLLVPTLWAADDCSRLAQRADDNAAVEPDKKPDAPPQQKKDPLCLDKPFHWSERPKLTPGTEIIFYRFLEFETPDGEKYQAKAFLIEIRPDRVEFPETVPAEVQEKRRSAPPRMICLGYQIEADENFQPDYRVPKQYVKKMPNTNCMYRVSLGTVDCDVRLAGEAKLAAREPRR